ncbi:ankyrin repeat-containing domain protein [Apodospora peruviana]|uniref:Ankyrin repeat-containing domain protein n=1 Tax=Apodospora peruviana TaxID=516989 RepID=A0AAE0M3R7_9PEZI|nr:ankyrin repeat-containing domain protein [Apodospora peruviana]
MKRKKRSAPPKSLNTSVWWSQFEPRTQGELKKPDRRQLLPYLQIGAWYDDIIALLLAKATFPTEVVQQALAAILGDSGGDDDAIVRQYATVCHLVIAAGNGWDWTIRYIHHRPMLSAASSEHIDVLRALLDKGADPNVQGDHGTTLHQYKRSTGPVPATVATAEALLQHGASPELEDHKGETPLHAIAEQGDLQDLKLYLDYCYDADVALRQCNIHGESLLHYAAMGRHVDVVEFLLSRGLDVNAANNNGWTPLICALMPSLASQVSDSLDIARLFPRHNSHADTITAENWTPIHSLASWPPPNHSGLQTWPGESTAVTPLVQELVRRGAILDTCAPVLRGKHIRYRTVLAMWGVKIQRLAEAETTRLEEEVPEEDTTPHMCALRVASEAVFQTITDHLASITGKQAPSVLVSEPVPSTRTE